jgi:peptidoglycan/LPS O-acetylase OafA/YrhL
MAAISALSAAVVLPRELAGLKGGHWQTPRIRGYAAYGLPIAWGLTAVWVAERSGKPGVAAAALAGAGLVLLLSLIAGRPGRGAGAQAG